MLAFSVGICIVIFVFLAWLFATFGAIIYVTFRKLLKDE